MTFWRCFYHVIWTMKYRSPSITPEFETLIFEIIEAKTVEHGGQLLSVNAVPDHVHIAAAIPPRVAIAVWVKSMKGVSSYEINRRFPDLDEVFRWQEGYGVLTFGAKNADVVVNYVRRQKEHHAANHLMPYLEQVED